MEPLPQNWTRYTTEDGKVYYHNAVTNLTQWDRPAPEAPPVAEDVFQYTPTAKDLGVSPDPVPTSGDNTTSALADVFGASPLPVVAGTTESELVNLRSAPSGRLGNTEWVGTGSGSGSGGVSLGGSMTSSTTSASTSSRQAVEEAPGWAGGWSAWLLTSAQRLFDISTDDVVRRLRLVLLPYPPPPPGSPSEDFRQKPDFYGPFWVATTAVLFLAATGNFARVVETADHRHFKADYSLIRLAAMMIYGCLIALPVLARISLFASGEEVSSINFQQLICLCGYALAPTIPVSILCLIPLDAVRWLVVLLGLGLSLFFLRAHLWVDLEDVKAPWLKWGMMIGPCVAQAVIFIVYRTHFFSSTVVA